LRQEIIWFGNIYMNTYIDFGGSTFVLPIVTSIVRITLFHAS